MLPPWLRAESHAHRQLNTLPKCMRPEGDGAKRPTTGVGAEASLLLGAVDVATEPELALYDMAALDIIVREAGGRFTNLDGADGVAGPRGDSRRAGTWSGGLVRQWLEKWLDIRVPGRQRGPPRSLGKGL